MREENMNLKTKNEWLKNEILESKYCTTVCQCVCACLHFYCIYQNLFTYNFTFTEIPPLLQATEHLLTEVWIVYKSKHSYALIIFSNDSALHFLTFLNILRPLEFFGCSVVIFLPIYFSPWNRMQMSLM